MTIKRCNDPKCENVGNEFVDRGYGYPVCPQTPQRAVKIQMNPMFKGTYKEEA